MPEPRLSPSGRPLLVRAPRARHRPHRLQGRLAEPVAAPSWAHRSSGYARDVPTDPSLYALARVAEHVEHVDGDIRDGERVAEAIGRLRPEIVLHLAAQPLVRRSFRDPSRPTRPTSWAPSTCSTPCARRRRRPRRVVVSSDKCYENREWPWGYRESEPMGGHDPYSSSKGCAELVTAAYRALVLRRRRAAPRQRAGRQRDRRRRLGRGPPAARRLSRRAGRRRRSASATRRVRPWQHVLNPLSGYLRARRRRLCATPRSRPGLELRPRRRRRAAGALDRRAPGRAVGRPLRWEVDPGPHPHEAQWLKLDSSLARARLDWTPGWDLDAGSSRPSRGTRALRDGADVRAGHARAGSRAFAGERRVTRAAPGRRRRVHRPPSARRRAARGTGRGSRSDAPDAWHLQAGRLWRAPQRQAEAPGERRAPPGRRVVTTATSSALAKTAPASRPASSPSGSTATERCATQWPSSAARARPTASARSAVLLPPARQRRPLQRRRAPPSRRRPASCGSRASSAHSIDPCTPPSRR